MYHGNLSQISIVYLQKKCTNDDLLFSHALIYGNSLHRSASGKKKSQVTFLNKSTQTILKKKLGIILSGVAHITWKSL